jgi:hypothetical protein
VGRDQLHRRSPKLCRLSHHVGQGLHGCRARSKGGCLLRLLLLLQDLAGETGTQRHDADSVHADLNSGVCMQRSCVWRDAGGAAHAHPSSTHLLAQLLILLPFPILGMRRLLLLRLHTPACSTTVARLELQPASRRVGCAAFGRQTAVGARTCTAAHRITALT